MATLDGRDSDAARARLADADVAIRAARPDEHEAIAEVTVAGYRALYGEDLGPYTNDLRDVAGRARAAEVLVAIVGAEIAGSVTYVGDAGSPLAEGHAEDEASIRMLAVAPEHARRGIGRALSNACIARARLAGKRALRLHADAVMEPPRRLYESLGFRRDTASDYTASDGTRLHGYVLPLT